MGVSRYPLQQVPFHACPDLKYDYLTADGNDHFIADGTTGGLEAKKATRRRLGLLNTAGLTVHQPYSVITLRSSLERM